MPVVLQHLQDVLYEEQRSAKMGSNCLIAVYILVDKCRGYVTYDVLISRYASTGILVKTKRCNLKRGQAAT